jgi:hypothetical protein
MVRPDLARRPGERQDAKTKAGHAVRTSSDGSLRLGCSLVPIPTGMATVCFL